MNRHTFPHGLGYLLNELVEVRYRDCREMISLRVLLTLSYGRLYITRLQSGEQPLFPVQNPFKLSNPTKYHPFVFELATRKSAELIEQLTEIC
jgi:hypothetical protein